MSHNINKLILLFIQFGMVFVFNGCKEQSSKSGSVGSSQSSTASGAVPLTVQAKYAATMTNGSVTTGSSNTTIMERLTGTLNCVNPLLNYDNAPVVFTFDDVGNVIGTSVNNVDDSTIELIPMDKGCKFTVVRIKLKDIEDPYTFDENPLSLAGSTFNNAVWSSAKKTDTNSNTAHPFIYVSMQFNLNLRAGPIALSVKYGDNINAVAANASTGFAMASLAPPSDPSVRAPTYCIGDPERQNCDDLNNVQNFKITYFQDTDSTYYVVKEERLRLFVKSNDPDIPQQSGESYKVFSFAPSVLPNNGDGALVNGSAGMNCGNLSAPDGIADMGGCTYEMIDALYNSTTISPDASGNVYGNYLLLNFDSITGFGAEFLGWTPPRPMFNKFAQEAVKYFIIQHLDSATGIAGYQLFVLNPGYTPLSEEDEKIAVEALVTERVSTIAKAALGNNPDPLVSDYDNLALFSTFGALSNNFYHDVGDPAVASDDTAGIIICDKYSGQPGVRIKAAGTWQGEFDFLYMLLNPGMLFRFDGVANYTGQWYMSVNNNTPGPNTLFFSNDSEFQGNGGNDDALVNLNINSSTANFQIFATPGYMDYTPYSTNQTPLCEFSKGYYEIPLDSFLPGYAKEGRTDVIDYFYDTYGITITADQKIQVPYAYYNYKIYSIFTPQGGQTGGL